METVPHVSPTCPLPVSLSDTRLRMCPGLELMLKQTSMLLRGRWTMK